MILSQSSGCNHYEELGTRGIRVHRSCHREYASRVLQIVRNAVGCEFPFDLVARPAGTCVVLFLFVRVKSRCTNCSARNIAAAECVIIDRAAAADEFRTGPCADQMRLADLVQ